MQNNKMLILIVILLTVGIIVNPVRASTTVFLLNTTHTVNGHFFDFVLNETEGTSRTDFDIQSFTPTECSGSVEGNIGIALTIAYPNGNTINWLFDDISNQGAVATRAVNGFGIQTVGFSVPLVTFPIHSALQLEIIIGCTSIRSNWQPYALWITDQLDATGFQAGTWSMNYYTNRTFDGVDTHFTFSFGDVTAPSSLSGIVPILPAPSAPQNLTIVSSETSNTLIWQAPVNGTADGYKIYRSLISGNEQLLFTVGNVLNYTDSTSGCVNEFYKVKAFNSGGDSPFSNEAQGKPLCQSGVVVNNLVQVFVLLIVTLAVAIIAFAYTKSPLFFLIGALVGTLLLLTLGFPIWLPILTGLGLLVYILKGRGT